MPHGGFKAQSPSIFNKGYLLSNDSLRSLTLKFSCDLNDNYLDFTKILLKAKQIASFTLNLNGKNFINDINICKFVTSSPRLTKLGLENILFSNKNAYI